MKRYKQANEGIHAPEEVKENAARPSQKLTYPRWTGAVAAVLALMLVGIGVAVAQFKNSPFYLSHIADGISFTESGPPMPYSDDDPVGRSIDQPETYSAHALSLAVYPEMAPYPDYNDYFADIPDDLDSTQKASDAYNEAFDAWWNSYSALHSNTDYTGMMDGFLARSAAEFLTDAGEENRIYSPLNVYLALSMLAETAGGNSRAQILDLLQVDSIEALRSRADALWKDNYRDDGIATSLLANSLWLRNDMTYSQDTLSTLAERYYASSFSGEMGSAEYDQALQDWINGQTNGLLAQQAEGLAFDPQTVLALASTIYFKAAWSGEFDPGRTEEDVFHTPSGDVKTDFMHRTATGFYYWGEHFAAVQLYFQEGGSMWLILPDEGYSADELLKSGEAMEFLMADKSLEQDSLSQGKIASRSYLDIHLSMPKFDVSSDLDLTDGLKALGVTDVFDGLVSNFAPLGASTNDPLYVTSAQHAARVKVDEEGCEAAAYTVMMVYGDGAMPETDEVDFILNRPFLFAITGDSGLPLFTGVVNQPNG